MSLKDKKRLIIITTIIMLCFVVMTYQYSTQRWLSLRFLSYPFDVLNQITTNLKHSVSNYFFVYQENARLKEQLTKLQIERHQYGEVIEENKRLQSLLEFKPTGYKIITSARIIGRGYDKILEIMKLDKGKTSSIKKDMAVITPKGLLGKIYSVYEDYSEVLLVRDINFSTAVRIQSSRVEGVLSGTGFHYLLLNYIPPEEKVEKGDVVITSGLDGIFPVGIPVGVVHYVNKEDVEFFQLIKVLPFQNDIKAEEAIVVAKPRP